MPFSYQVNNTNATEWLVCFYGYGQHSSMYKPLYQLLQPKYNIVTILYNTEATKAITKQDVTNYIHTVFNTLGIQSCSVLSFSLGGRYLLCLLETMPQYITQAVAIAPDGILINKWNTLATHTWLGHALFSFFVQHEKAYLNTIQLLYWCKLLPKPLYTFIKWKMRDKANRIKVYNTWMQTKHIIPQLKLANSHVVQYKIKLSGIFGTNDVIIKSNSKQKFMRYFPTANCIEIQSDHQMLHHSLYNVLIPLLCS